mmetsp:Transcript_13689/g.32532  ORF Transcript_13689/g.32532 Transcript_13689/m.32532 type:complete len:272 (+) Transcript_13689:1549-2364(+)
MICCGRTLRRLSRSAAIWTREGSDCLREGARALEKLLSRPSSPSTNCSTSSAGTRHRKWGWALARVIASPPSSPLPRTISRATRRRRAGACWWRGTASSRSCGASRTARPSRSCPPMSGRVSRLPSSLSSRPTTEYCTRNTRRYTMTTGPRASTPRTLTTSTSTTRSTRARTRRSRLASLARTLSSTSRSSRPPPSPRAGRRSPTTTGSRGASTKGEYWSRVQLVQRIGAGYRTGTGTEKSTAGSEQAHQRNGGAALLGGAGSASGGKCGT